MDPTKMKTVYTVVERNKKSYWLKLGVGFVNHDGSLNLKLDANPNNGTLQVRDYEPDKRADDASSADPFGFGRRAPAQQEARLD